MYQVIGASKTRTFRVLWMLEELGLEYEHLPALPQTPEVKAYNPGGKVPVLLDDGQPVIDSTAIITYLADKHGALTYPAGTLERARQDALTHFVLDEMDAVLWTAARHSFILPEEMRVPQIKDSLKWEFARSEKILMDRMGEGPFLMGARMTVADIIACHCAGWAIGAKFGLTEPRLKEYSKRLTAREAYIRAREA
jgi:glutathione S-transferase